MPLLMAQSFLGNLRTFRILWIKSRFGSGKTALAFKLAHDLQAMGAVRNIVSNCASPWCDPPESVQIVDGFADTCLIMDEAGMFMSNVHKAQKYLAWMRRLNIILILPTFLAPAMNVRFFTVRRTWNLQVAGLPLWVYRSRLMDGEEMNFDTFYWWNPQEIYGAYDTGGYPSDDGSIEDWLIKWTEESARQRGYQAPANVRRYASFVNDDETSGDEQPGMVEALRGVSDQLAENAQTASDLMALSQVERGKKRGR